MEQSDPTLLGRFEGRLFSHEGRLHLVVDVDPQSGLAWISCRADGRQRLFQMPIAEVGAKLTSDLRLDASRSAAASNRIIQRSDGWFFTTREGLQGPYPSADEAKRLLGKHIIAVQGRSGSTVENRELMS